MAIKISFGSRLMGGRQSSSLTCMSWRFGTPREDCESFAPRKKSDSSLSPPGAGELLDEVERASSCASTARSMSSGWADCCCCRVSWSGAAAAGSATVLLGAWLEMIAPLSAMISRDARCLMVAKVIVDSRGAKGGFGGKLSRGKDGDCH